MAVTPFTSDSPVESVRQTIRSTSTCSNATVLSLQTLFRSSTTTMEGEPTTVKRAGRGTKTTNTSTASSRAKATRTRTTKTALPEPITTQDTARLSNQEKLALATEVFNTTLKTLSDAVKTATTISKEQKKSSSAVKRGTKLGRPVTGQVEEKSVDSGVSAVAECARLSLSSLRMLKGEQGEHGEGMPNMQLEQGACVLAGRLLALGMNDMAYKELRGLRRRIQNYLDSMETGIKNKEARDGEEEPTTQRMSDLLSFSSLNNARSVLGLLVSFQVNALRLIAAEKRLATVQKVLSALQLVDKSSPANTIINAIESGALSQDKGAVQLQVLASTVLSLAANEPSNSVISGKDRLKPITLLTLQLLSLEIRCMSWKASGHVCEDGKEMWDPLARYVGVFAQATKSIEKPEFASIYKAIVRLQSAFAKIQIRNPARSKDNLSVARIATILGTLAQDAGCLGEALKLFTESLGPLSAGQCLGLASVRCKIASLHFQAPRSSAKFPTDISTAISEATNVLSLPLKGSAQDLDEILVHAAKLKKLAMAWFGELISKGEDGCENEAFPAIYEYLKSFVRFLRRYTGRRPADDEPDAYVAFQKRKDSAQNIVLAAVDSTVAITRLSVTSQKPLWEDMISTLLDCQRLLTTIEPHDTDAGTEITGMALVKLSNLYWSRYIREKESGKGARELLPLLKQSANVLSGCSPSQRTTGFAPLKYERLAYTYVEGNMVSDADIAFCQSIGEHIAAGALQKHTSTTDGLFAHQIIHDPKDGAFTLGRVFSAYLKVKLRNKRSVAHDIFDDETLPSAQRGHVLEWQLGILTDLQSSAYNDDIFRSVFTELASRLLEIYAVERHPLRRLRVVLLGLRFGLEQPGSVDAPLLETFVAEGMNGLENDSLGEDADIESIAAHLRNSVRLTLGLHQGTLDMEQLNSITSAWSLMLRKCQDLKSLARCVGNIQYYLLQMKAVVDYTEIHGLWKLQLSTLELVLRVTELQGTGAFSEAVMILSRLVLQYCRLGHCNKARLLLSRADGYISHNEVSCLARLSFELARLGFYIEIGETQSAASVLSAARMVYEKNQPSSEMSVLTKISWERLVADVAYMSSRLAFAQGSIKDALYYAKLSVRLNCRIWAKVEKLAQKKHDKAIYGDSSELEIVVEGMAKLEVSKTSSNYSQGAPFWPHIGSHHSSLLNLASLSAHHGLFQDAIYYGEQALKINKSLNANVRLIESQAQLGSHWVLGGHLTEGQELLKSAKESSDELDNSIELVSVKMSLAVLYRAQGDYRNEYRALREAEKLTTGFFESEPAQPSATSELEEKMDKLRIRPKSRSTRQPAATATRRTRSGTTSARSTPKPPPNQGTALDSHMLSHVKSEILRQQAVCLRAQKEFEKASSLLTDARKFAVTRDSKISVHIGESEHLLADAIRHFATHAVYCVLPESTISLPSLQSPSRPASEASSGKSATRKTRAPTRGTRSKAPPATEDFSVMLSKAGDCLNEIFHTATILGSTLDSHSASRLMSRISMLSHATAVQSQITLPQSPATMNEIGRIGAFARERAAINIDRDLADYCDPLLWPRSQLVETDDVPSDFTAEYVDILPGNWNVLSLSLSADQTEFVVSRLHQGRSPFLLRLPLRRGNSEDEGEQFTFEDGRDEMQELIRLANESAHAAKLQIERHSKKEWWKNREALDRRMENLLQNIENVWFGGFRGIFSPIPHDVDSLAQFASSFENILDTHLPSRAKGSRAEGPKLTLHPNVLELFVGVKDLAEQEDPEDAVMDLLYFVVDILQFQGERNAYDEIDFDMMVVETLDVVRTYHETNDARTQPNNTVLVLDKSLHLFPWESLPCLQGLPVCRVPSLECLRDRVLQFRTQKKTSLGIDRRNGTYILNPTGDLQTTQATFEKSLSRMDGWSGLVNRQPTEDEFQAGLESKSLFLYFGHGSGAQYIRGRTVKRLDQCAVTFLLGCSSGTLTEAGEYEPYGTPMNYLQAGAPALVATLWDVTDKDIDRFAKTTFEHWGLLRAEPCGEDRGIGEDRVALDAAVSQSRGACVLKYLNGAAPVVYGVPGVFLE
ncbi:peptidase family C50-domain-containing protein [Aspergillus crustosus]